MDITTYYSPFKGDAFIKNFYAEFGKLCQTKKFICCHHTMMVFTTAIFQVPYLEIDW